MNVSFLYLVPWTADGQLAGLAAIDKLTSTKSLPNKLAVPAAQGLSADSDFLGLRRDQSRHTWPATELFSPFISNLFLDPTFPSHFHPPRSCKLYLFGLL